MSAEACDRGGRSISAPRITRLSLTDFRNYSAATIHTGAPNCVFHGPNGSGKTNLLEALSLLSPGRGMRRAKLDQMVRQGSGAGFTVFSEIETDDDTVKIGTGTSTSALADAISTRVTRINGTPAKRSEELLQFTRVLWLTPAMDGLFTGSASDRRRFTDRMVLSIEPQHARRVANYEKAISQRNRLLDDYHGQQSDIQLDAIELQLGALGAAMIAARAELVDLISLEMERLDQTNFQDFPTATLFISDGLREAEQRHDEMNTEEQLLRLYRDGRGRDRAAKRTLIGPHRADLNVQHKEKDIEAALCSTGEQKALLTGLVLAHAKITSQIAGMAPILLLDEIAAHFDPFRREALFQRIEALGGQTFMTGTDAFLFEALGDQAKRFRVDSGHVTEA